MPGDEVKLYNPNDGLTGRDGGPYLDQVEMHDAETRRAVVEKRDPDYNNLQPTAGVPLVTAGTLVNMDNPASRPSQQDSTAVADMVDLAADNTDFAITAIATAPNGIDPGAGLPPAVQEDPDEQSGSNISPSSGDPNSGTDNSSGSSTTPVSSEPIPVPDSAVEFPAEPVSNATADSTPSPTSTGSQ